MPPCWSAGNGTSTHAGYRFSDSSVIIQTAHNSFICTCCWYKFLVIHEEKNMFWLFGIAKNTLTKIATRTLCSLSPVDSPLPQFVTMNRGTDETGLCKVASFWDCLSLKRKQHCGTMAKNPVSSTFPWPTNPLSNHYVCFITYNFINWNNYGAVLVRDGKQYVVSFAQDFAGW